MPTPTRRRRRRRRPYLRTCLRDRQRWRCRRSCLPPAVTWARRLRLARNHLHFCFGRGHHLFRRWRIRRRQAEWCWYWCQRRLRARHRTWPRRARRRLLLRTGSRRQNRHLLRYLPSVLFLNFLQGWFELWQDIQSAVFPDTATTYNDQSVHFPCMQEHGRRNIVNHA